MSDTISFLGHKVQRISKRGRTAIFKAAVLAAFSFAPAVASADLIWDPDGVGGSATAGGAGSWDGGLKWVDPFEVYTTWPVGGDNTAVFTNTAGLVTLAAPVNANALRFDSTGYELTGSTLTLVTGTLFTPVIGVTTAGQSATISSALAGTVGLTKAGEGTLILSGTNTFSGSLLISDGVLSFSQATNLDSATDITINTGKTLQYTGAGATTLTKSIFSSSGRLEITSATGNLTADGPLTSPAAEPLIKTGAGTLTLGTAATHTANIAVEQGRLYVSSGNQIPGLAGLTLGSATTSGKLQIADGAFGSASTVVKIGAAGGEIQVDANTFDFYGTITPAAGVVAPTAPIPVTAPGLTKTGPGKLRLSSNNNSFIGTLSVLGGTLEITSDKDFGNGYNGVLIDGAILQIVDAFDGAAPIDTIDPGDGDSAANSKFRVFYIGDAGATFDIQASNTLQINDGPVFAALNQLQSRNYNAAGSPDVLTKTGTGRLLVGNATDDFGTTFSGKTVINDGLVRVDGAKGLGNFDVTVTGTGRLAFNATGIMPNPIIVNGGTFGAMGGDRLFGGLVTIQQTWNYNSSEGSLDLALFPAFDRSAVLLGPVNDMGQTVNITGNFGNATKGIVLANTTGTPSSLTGSWNVQSGGVLAIGGTGTGGGSAQGLPAAVITAPGRINLQFGATFGFRSDDNTTFSGYPVLPTMYNLVVGPLTSLLSVDKTLTTSPLALNSGDTVGIYGENGYRLAPSTLTLGNFSTLNFQGGNLMPGILSVASGNTVSLGGNGSGALIINNEAGGPHVTTGATFNLNAGGTLTLQGAPGLGDPFGGATVAFNGGALGLTSTAGGAVFNKALSFTSDQTVRHFGNVSNTFGSGSNGFTIGTGATLTVDMAAGSLNLATPLQGTGTLRKIGAGTLVLSADNSASTVPVVLDFGTMLLTNAAGKSVPAAGLTVNKGTVDLNATSQTISPLNLVNGNVVNGTLVSTAISKTGNAASVGDITARLNMASGTITAAGGTLRISNNSAVTPNALGSATVNATTGGTISVPLVTGGSNPLGTAAVNLSGGNLLLNGTTGYSATPNGLTGTFYNLPVVQDNGSNGWIPMDTAAGFEAEMAKWTSVGATLTDNFNFSNIQTNSFNQNTPAPMTVSRNPLDTQSVVGMWKGKISIPTAGDYKFTTSSDDGSVLFIDGVRVVHNNFSQGGTDRIGSINLTAGMHDIVIGYFNGSGGAALTSVAYFGPGMFTRAGITGAITHSTVADFNNAITATGDSSITVRDAGQANLGTLTLGGGTLRVTGTIAPASIALTADSTIETTQLGGAVIPAASSGAFKLTKTGPGTMLASVPLGHTGGTDIRGGTLRVTHGTALPATGNTVIGNGALLDVPIANAYLGNVVVENGGTLNLGVAQNAFLGATPPTTPIAGTVTVNGYDMPLDYDMKVAAGGTVNYVQGGADRNHRGDIEVSGNGQVIFNQNGGNTVNMFGAITVPAGSTVGLTMTGGNTLHLQGVNTLNGPFIVESGTLRLRDAGTALLVPSTTIFGGQFTISDGGSTTVQNRYNDTGEVIFRAGTFRGQMRSGGGTATEVFGQFTAAGTGTIQLDSAGTNGIIQLRTSNFVTPKGARMNWAGNNIGNTGSTQRGQFFMDLFNGADPVASLVNGVLWGGGTVGTSFATYNATNGVFALVANEASVNPADWAITDNVQPAAALAADIVLSADTTVNTLNLDAGATARTLDLGSSKLTVNTGGFIQRGAGGLSIGNTSGSGMLTAGVSNELFLLGNAAPGIIVNAQIVDNGNPVAVTIGGGNTIRLSNVANNFTGGVYIGGSTLLAQSSTNAGNVLGSNTLYFPGNGTLSLRDDSGNVTYGNAVVVDGAATFNLDRATATGAAGTFTMGDITIAPGRTVTTVTANSKRINFGNLVMQGSATWNGAANTDFLTASLPAGAVLTKTGGGFFNLANDNSATYLGTTVINGGSLQIQHLRALGAADPVVTVNNGGRFVVNIDNFNFSNVTTNAGGLIQIRKDQSIGAGAVIPTTPIYGIELETINTIGSDFDGVRIAPGGRFQLNTGSAQTYNYQSDLVILGNMEVLNNQNQTNTLNFDGVISGPGTLIRNQTTGTLNVNLNVANTYTGGTISVGGGGPPIRGQVAGAFGPGPVIALSGAIDLNAAGAASNTVVAIDSPINYNANRGAGGNVVRAGGTHPLVGPYMQQNLGGGTLLSDGKTYQGTVGQINIGSAVTDFQGDTFDVRAYNIISGDEARLALLSRGGNLTVETNTVIGHSSNSANSAQNLGTNTDLFFGITSDHSHALTIGANTPWKGVSNDRSDRRWTVGPILVDDGSAGGTQPATVTQVFMNALNGAQLMFGNNTVPMSIIPAVPGGGKVEVVTGPGPYKLPGANGAEVSNRFNIEGGSTAGPINDFSGVSLFRIYGNFYPNRDHSTAGVPLIVESGGQLDSPGISATATDNRSGNPTGTSLITLKSGGIMFLNDAKSFQNSMSGRVTAETGAIVRVAQIDALLDVAGTGIAPIFDFMSTSPNQLVVRIEAGNGTDATAANRGIKLLNEAAADNSLFVISGGDRGFVPTVGTPGLALNNGHLTNDNSDRTIQVQNRTTEAITVTNTATFSSTRNRTFNINNDVSATGRPLTVGAVGVVDGYLKDGSVNFAGVLTSQSMNLVGGANAYAGANNSANIINGSFAVDGITIGDLSRFEMNLAQAGTTNVLQKFIIDGDYLHRDRRRLRVNRSSGTGTDVNLQNVFMNPGSVLAIDEADTATSIVRVNATLRGDATFVSGVNDQFDITGVQSDIPGTRRTLTLGRIADTNGIPNFHSQLVNGGSISGDITVNQVKGGLTFTLTGDLLPGAIINNLGVGPTGNLEDGQITIQRGRDREPVGGTGSTWLSGGKINLDNDQDLIIQVDEVATGSPKKVNNPNIVVEIQAGNGLAGTGAALSGVGRIQAARNTDSNVNGRVIVNEVILNANSTASLEPVNDQELEVKLITVNGNNATILNAGNNQAAGSRLLLHDIVEPANDKTINFAGRNIRVSPLGTNTTVGIGGNKLVVDSLSLDIEPGAGNTGTIAGNVQVNTVLNVKSGTVNMTGKTITGQAPALSLVSGLREAVLSGSDDEATVPPTTGLIRRGPERGNFPHGFGYADNTTVVYSGQINIPDNGTTGDSLGSVAFAESFDDNVLIRLDGNNDGDFGDPEDFLLNNNGATNDATGVWTTSTGWHNVEFRFGQGGGGAGPWSQSGWDRRLAFGIDLTDAVATEPGGDVSPLNLPLMANYVAPLDDGSMNLFRTTTTSYSGVVTVDAGATVNAAGIQDIGTANINGTANVGYIRGGTLSVGAGGVAAIAANGTDAGHSRVTALTIAGATDAWTGKLDLNNNDLIVDGGNLANINNQLKSGRAGGAWNGNGIASAAAAADTRGITALGAILNNDDGSTPLKATFAGQSVTADSVLVKYTYNGDSDLSGVVDATDYFQIDVGFLSAGTKTGWRWGDYNYDGLIDIDDYFLIDVAYSLQSGALGGGSAPAAPSAPSAAVPEPGTLSLLALGAAALLGRRRRSR